MDDGEGYNYSGAPAEASGIPRVQSEIHSGIASNTLSEKLRNEAGRPGGGAPPPPPPPSGRPILTGSHYQNSYRGSGAR